jgi:hypothetical protein
VCRRENDFGVIVEVELRKLRQFIIPSGETNAHLQNIVAQPGDDDVLHPEVLDDNPFHAPCSLCILKGPVVVPIKAIHDILFELP